MSFLTRQELMWVCAVMPKNWEKEVKTICAKKNERIGLSDSVFKLPLHISLKKSFYLTQFQTARKDAIQILQDNSPLILEVQGLKFTKRMIWIQLKNKTGLKNIHDSLDHVMEEKYGVVPHHYDLNFQPHISLYTRGDREDLERMYKALDKVKHAPWQAGKKITVTDYVIGSNVTKDRYYTFGEKEREE